MLHLIKSLILSAIVLLANSLVVARRPTCVPNFDWSRPKVPHKN